MQGFAFDTLQFAEELKKAGFTPEQAEGQARAQAKIINLLVEERLATKSDIDQLKQTVKEDIDQSKYSLKEDIEHFKHSIKDDIDHFKQEIKEDMHTLERRIDKLDASVENLSLKLTIRIGSMLGIAIGALALLLRH